MSLSKEQNELLATRFLGFVRKDCQICEDAMKRAESVPNWAAVAVAGGTSVFPLTSNVPGVMHLPMCAVRAPEVLTPANSLAMVEAARKERIFVSIVPRSPDNVSGNYYAEARTVRDSDQRIGESGAGATMPEAIAESLIRLLDSLSATA